MSIEVVIVTGPLSPAVPWELALPEGEAGAVVCFEGVVRAVEDGRALAALEYQVYEPMTQRELEKLAQQTREAHGLLRIGVEHSRGVVPVGACSFRLRVASAHRAAALAGMAAFIDRMKQQVPIWKSPVWRDEAAHAPKDSTR